MDRMADVKFHYYNNSTPLSLRVLEQHNIGSHKVILANQLFSHTDVKELLTSVNILHQCNIGELSVSHNKIKKKHPKDNKCKVKKEENDKLIISQ